MKSYHDELAGRLCAAVSKRLVCSVMFVRWDKDARTHADVPVFRVPADKQSEAQSAGLTVDSMPLSFGGQR